MLVIIYSLFIILLGYHYTIISLCHTYYYIINYHALYYEHTPLQSVHQLVCRVFLYAL